MVPKLKERKFNALSKLIIRETGLKSPAAHKIAKLIYVKGLTRKEAARETGHTPQYIGWAIRNFNERSVEVWGLEK